LRKTPAPGKGSRILDFLSEGADVTRAPKRAALWKGDALQFLALLEGARSEMIGSGSRKADHLG